jgi:4-oxalocrotonate tautomerase
MPFVHIRIAGPSLAAEPLRRLQQGATELMVEILGKRPAVTSVLVEPAPIAGWTVGGQRLATAAHLDAKITAGTNSAAEKARFIQAAAGLLKEVLGTRLPVATYVVIDEIPADDWGYDGETQAVRHASSRAAAAA